MVAKDKLIDDRYNYIILKVASFFFQKEVKKLQTNSGPKMWCENVVAFNLSMSFLVILINLLVIVIVDYEWSYT